MIVTKMENGINKINNFNFKFCLLKENMQKDLKNHSIGHPMCMLENTFFFRIFLLTLIILFSFNQVNAETYELTCIYEGGKKNITIDEENKTITNFPEIYGSSSWNYRKLNEYVYAYEIAMLKAQSIYRFIIDLENLLEETIIVKVTKENINEIHILGSKFHRKEITYDLIDQAKIKIFEQWFKDPKKTQNKVVKNWRNDWEGGHPDEYIMYENNSDLTYQFTMIHRCNFIN